MLGIRLELVATGCQGQPITYSRQYILNRTARRRVIENLGGGDERKPVTLRPLAQPRLLRHFVFAAMAGQHAIEPIVKGIA